MPGNIAKFENLPNNFAYKVVALPTLIEIDGPNTIG